MKAIVFRAINQLPEIEDIYVGTENKPKIKLTYAAFNHRDLWLTKGLYPGYISGAIMGSDGVGELNGKRVIINPGWGWGSNEAYQGKNFRVLGVPDHGTFAEYIYVDEDKIFDLPDYISDEEAACLPVAGVTAYRALFVKGNIKPGENVLITGIGGGAAMLAAQMAKAAGGNVFVTSSSEEKIKQSLSHGYSGGANYTNENWADELKDMSGGIDIVIDSAAGDGIAAMTKICNPGARIVFFGGSKGKINNINPQLLFWKQISLHGTTMGSDLDFKNFLSFYFNHKLRPVIDEIIPFEQFKKGFIKLEEGSQNGKIVLKIND